MTIEQTTSMAANDVEGLIFACGGKNGKCQTVITVPFTSGTEMIWACPVCGENWFREKAERIKAFENLVIALSEFQRTDTLCNLRFKIRTLPASASGKSAVS
jgi:predicted  nucleic acid-binding Zn-ribbon protein